jgi:AcrR family transcriptional regulator
MFDDSSKRNKAIQAALQITAERGWENVTFTAIVERAGLSLADLRREFACKSDILKAFQAEVDAEVLAKTKLAMPEQMPRDRLFDLIMTRFEVMAPYKPALGRIHADLCCHPGEAALLVCSTLASQYWMLVGAGAKLDGAGAGLRVTGLAAIYRKVFRVWLDDASPGLDRTMAVLDRKLRKGEDWLAGMESARQDLCRFVCGFMPRGWKRRAARSTAEHAGSASPSPGAV